MFDSILKFNPKLNSDDINGLDRIRNTANKLDINYEENFGLGKIQNEILEKTVEIS